MSSATDDGQLVVDDYPCRIYDVNYDRFAIVDARVYPHMIIQYQKRWKRWIPRLWTVRPPHKTRKGQKLYFVNSSGWREARPRFLHVEIMTRFGPPKPSPKYTIVNHIDGDEWNCLLENLEWSTHLRNRRTKSYGRNAGRAWAWAFENNVSSG
jgi:hypothetical protein